ncbi:hypothetical protein [Nonomuraea sp. NPDC049400]|uniref:hypothetical protein n=1 Tax=Nonomuraea sp. NPDC049400 TaxID=3364352 RepID=UPI00378BC03F
MTFNVTGFDLECTACGVEGPHHFDGEETVCLACGTPREVEAELITAVLDMKFCDWCRETLPANHTCRADEPSCESRAHLYPDRCGICPTDLALQKRDLDRRAAEFEHGSPSDLLDHP